MSSIPTAKEAVASVKTAMKNMRGVAEAFFVHAEPIGFTDLDAILAELSRLEEENGILQQAVLDRLAERKALAEENAKLRAELDEAKDIARVFGLFYPTGQLAYRDEKLREALCAVPSPEARLITKGGAS